jgi:hypothetical protein
MLVVLPVSSSENNSSINTFVECLKFFGACGEHEALCVTSRDNELVANKLEKSIGGLFSSFKSFLFDNDSIPSGWPEGPNFYWGQTVGFLKKVKNSKPWMWMESDCLPIKNNWLDEIEKEYASCGKNFLGSIEYRTLGYPSHLSGCAVYPAATHHFIGNGWRWIHKSNIPFDVVFSSKILPFSSHSKKIRNLYRTYDYKLLDSKTIKFDFLTKSCPMEQANRIILNIEKEKELDASDVAAIHGCKDDSLFENVIKKQNK